MDESVKLAFPIPSNHSGDLCDSQLKLMKNKHCVIEYVPMKLKEKYSKQNESARASKY